MSLIIVYFATQDEAIAKEVERRRLEEELRRKEIQRICEEDDSLRELQFKLKTAYTMKEREAQVREKEAIKAIEAEKKRALEELDEYHRRQALLEEVKRQQEQKAENVRNLSILKDQIIAKENAMKVESEDQFLQEAREVERLSKKIQEEDEIEMRARMMKEEELKKYIEQVIISTLS